MPTPPTPPPEADPASPASIPPPLPSFPLPPNLDALPTPPSKADLFFQFASQPLIPPLPPSDPRVNLRNPSPPPPPVAFFPAPDSPPPSPPTALAPLPPLSSEPETLAEYRTSEGKLQRLSRLRSLFESIPPPASPPASTAPLPPLSIPTDETPSEESKASARKTYTRELWTKCGASVAASVPPSSPASSSPTPTPSSFSSGPLSPSAPPPPSSSPPSSDADRQSALRSLRWAAFERYAEAKEAELWKSFCEVDRDGNHRIGLSEVREACRRAGIEVRDQKQVEEFVLAMDRNGDGVISFDEWRDFLLLLPRPSTMKEIWRFYQTHRLDRPSMSRLTQDGDVAVVVGRGKSGWNRLLGRPGTLLASVERSSSLSRKEAAAQRAASLAGGTNLRAQAAREEREENGERRWVEECARAKRKREEVEREEREAKERKQAETAAGSSTLAFEESGVVAAAPTGAKTEEPKALTAAAGEKRAVEETRVAVEVPEEEEEEEVLDATHDMFAGAGKFLLAGGMAGAVSRTATAPFDRLKVYLITSPSDFPPPPPPGTKPTPPPPSPPGTKPKKRPRANAGSLTRAVKAVYAQGGGIKSFWTGNGLNIVKIFPESAIKFLSYESAKRVFAQYWDRVPDQTLISNSSRFVAGGIGGVVSQFCIYPIESLKTRVMSSSGSSSLRGNALILQTAHDMWLRGRFRFFFRGLPAGLIGVFPYSAIDMSTFEGIKLAYTQWKGEEPGIAGSLCFGAFSGGVGASSVYPLNLVRTRLQAQGTPSHPQTYTGIRDAAMKCYQREGWRGFYKGLTPTLVKVVPAVAISYAVYDASKKFLFAEDHHDPHGDSLEEE